MSKWKIFRRKWDDFDYEYIHPIRVFFVVKWEALRRAVAFARFSWGLYDFESDSMYALMAFKLERVKKCMDEGYGVYPKEVNSSIREAIRICKRLYERDYEDSYRKAHNKKWGRPKYFDKDGKFNFNLYPKNVKTKADRKKERNESFKIMHDGYRDRIADLSRLHDLLKMYQTQWYD